MINRIMSVWHLHASKLFKVSPPLHRQVTSVIRLKDYWKLSKAPSLVTRFQTAQFAHRGQHYI